MLWSECVCEIGGKMGLGSVGADFEELSGDPRGALVALLLPPSPEAMPTVLQPACVQAGGADVHCRNGCP